MPLRYLHRPRVVRDAQRGPITMHGVEGHTGCWEVRHCSFTRSFTRARDTRVCYVPRDGQMQSVRLTIARKYGLQSYLVPNKVLGGWGCIPTSRGQAGTRLESTRAVGSDDESDYLILELSVLSDAYGETGSNTHFGDLSLRT